MKRIDRKTFNRVTELHKESDRSIRNLIKHLYLLLNNDLCDPVIEIANIEKKFYVMLSTSCLNKNIKLTIFDKEYKPKFEHIDIDFLTIITHITHHFDTLYSFNVTLN